MCTGLAEVRLSPDRSLVNNETIDSIGRRLNIELKRVGSV